jgi:hypothetical protein
MAPLALTVWPDTQVAPSLTSQPTTGAMPAGMPRRPRGLWLLAAAMDSGVSALLKALHVHRGRCVGLDGLGTGA